MFHESLLCDWHASCKDCFPAMIFPSVWILRSDRIRFLTRRPCSKMILTKTQTPWSGLKFIRCNFSKSLCQLFYPRRQFTVIFPQLIFWPYGSLILQCVHQQLELGFWISVNYLSSSPADFLTNRGVVVAFAGSIQNLIPNLCQKALLNQSIDSLSDCIYSTVTS